MLLGPVSSHNRERLGASAESRHNPWARLSAPCIPKAPHTSPASRSKAVPVQAQGKGGCPRAPAHLQ